MFNFTIMKGNDIMFLSIKNYKQARSFERMLKDFKIMYQLHDNVTQNDKAVTGSFSDSEQDYLHYQEKPVTDWLSQIEQMRNETCQINIL